MASPPQDAAGLWAVLGHFDEYPGALPYQIADQVTLGDAKLQMAGFQTDDPPEKVVAFYRAEFKREQLFVPPPPKQIPLTGVTAFDPVSGLQKTVLVMPGAGGPTRVVLSIAPGKGLTENALAGDQKMPAGLPVFPKTDGVFRTDAQDGPRSSSTISFSAKGNPAEVLDFIQSGLAAQGLTQAKQGPAELGEGLRYARGAEGLQVTVLPIGNATEVTYIYVH